MINDSLSTKSMTKIGLMTLAMIFSPIVHAEPLSKEAIYARCYAQLTGLRPSIDDPNLATLRNNQGDPIAICLGFLEMAKLTNNANTRISNLNSTIAKNVLGHLHSVHASWFRDKDYQIPARRPFEYRALVDMIDPTSPALYMTRALFTPNAPASSIVKLPFHLRPMRTEMNPATGANLRRSKADYVYNGDAEFSFAPRGELIGVETQTPIVLTYKLRNNQTGNHRFFRTMGGGYLGTHSYLMETVNNDIDFQSDLFRLPRGWARAVFHDALCRELPVVRLGGDVDSFVRPNSSIAFRKDAACTRCHVSMDRIASVTRAFSYSHLAQLPDATNIAPLHYELAQSTKPSEAGWPAEPDSSFHERPPKGTLYYRTASNGSLVNIAVANLADLGAKLSEQDDFYLCLANRYYNYFTGKGITLEDAQVMNGYSADEKARLQIIKALGSNLKTHQSLERLIREILRRPEYSDSSFKR